MGYEDGKIIFYFVSYYYRGEYVEHFETQTSVLTSLFCSAKCCFSTFFPVKVIYRFDCILRFCQLNFVTNFQTYGGLSLRYNTLTASGAHYCKLCTPPQDAHSSFMKLLQLFYCKWYIQLQVVHCIASGKLPCN